MTEKTSPLERIADALEGIEGHLADICGSQATIADILERLTFKPDYGSEDALMLRIPTAD